MIGNQLTITSENQPLYRHGFPTPIPTEGPRSIILTPDMLLEDQIVRIGRLEKRIPKGPHILIPDPSVSDNFLFPFVYARLQPNPWTLTFKAGGFTDRTIAIPDSYTIQFDSIAERHTSKGKYRIFSHERCSIDKPIVLSFHID